MNKKNALLIIDAQYDFCHPDGALFTPGAPADMERLSDLIRRNQEFIDGIVLSLDTHPVNDISHPAFWQDEAGQFPPPFTPITFADVQARRWIPRFEPEKATAYLQQLEAQGEFGHFVWPEHCLAGSRGASLDDTLLEALRHWTRRGTDYQTVTKGTHPLSEHFGIFQAQIPSGDAPETQLNTALIANLLDYQYIYLAGEAKSHCVATSLKQAMDHAPELARRMVVIEDIMSDVTGLAHLGYPIYQKARQRGVQFVRSADVVLT